MSKTLFTQMQFDLNGLMSAVRMKQIGLPDIQHECWLSGRLPSNIGEVGSRILILDSESTTCFRVLRE